MKISTKEPLTVLVQENNAGMQEVFKHLPYVFMIIQLLSIQVGKKERKHKAVHGV